MKEAITETKPLVLDALLKIPATSMWSRSGRPLPADKARKEVNKRRRHFNMSKTGFVSQMGQRRHEDEPSRRAGGRVQAGRHWKISAIAFVPWATVNRLADFSPHRLCCMRALSGQSTDLAQLVAEFTGVFTNADGNLFAETYNQLNAYFAIVRATIG